MPNNCQGSRDNDSNNAAADAEAGKVQHAQASLEGGAGAKSTITRWGILAEDAMERARGDLILMSQGDDFSDSVGNEAVGPGFVLSLLMLDLRHLKQPTQEEMHSLLDKYRQRLRDLVLARSLLFLVLSLPWRTRGGAVRFCRPLSLASLRRMKVQIFDMKLPFLLAAHFVSALTRGDAFLQVLVRRISDSPRKRSLLDV